MIKPSREVIKNKVHKIIAREIRQAEFEARQNNKQVEFPDPGLSPDHPDYGKPVLRSEEAHQYIGLLLMLDDEEGFNQVIGVIESLFPEEMSFLDSIPFETRSKEYEDRYKYSDYQHKKIRDMKRSVELYKKLVKAQNDGDRRKAYKLEKEIERENFSPEVIISAQSEAGYWPGDY